MPFICLQACFRLARDNWKDSSKEYEQQNTNLIKAKSVVISYVQWSHE